ncbi:MAG: DUF1211 domain-containing membrane protein [Sphingomonas sp.]|nr:DUF1211 domain-containing membrane protein [Sphingomonas sp.]|tara:strand:- start:1748 stop:2359 length:612 start_codon:yes stop_codon:yes gene_type:complete
MQDGTEWEENREGAKRVEAFSDGVIAIVITIMVLEMRAPEETGWEHLLALWPVFTAYVLSYIYVAVYWANHHRLFSHARRVTNALIWSNIALLFALSLVPFATAYLGEHAFSRDATLFYMTVMLMPSLAYMWLQRVIRRTGAQGEASVAYHRSTMRKGVAATIVYAAGIPLTLITPLLGLGCAALVAIFWFLPKSPLDALFAR